MTQSPFETINAVIDFCRASRTMISSNAKKDLTKIFDKKTNNLQDDLNEEVKKNQELKSEVAALRMQS